jgi:hypothetical protein
MKFRVHEWIDTDLGDTHYGIQAKPSPTARWQHCVKGEEVILYKTKQAAKAVVKTLRSEAKIRDLAA